MNNKLNFKRIIIIVFVSIILAFTYNYFSVDGIPLFRMPLTINTVNAISKDDSLKGLKGLSLANVLGLYNQKAATFIDARDQWDYSEGHIIGALNIPEFSFSPDDRTLASIKKESLIIVYCDGDDCDTSKRLANELLKLGYKNTYVYLGGMTEWLEAKLPVENENLK